MPLLASKFCRYKPQIRDSLKQTEPNARNWALCLKGTLCNLLLHYDTLQYICSQSGSTPPKAGPATNLQHTKKFIIEEYLANILLL